MTGIGGGMDTGPNYFRLIHTQMGDSVSTFIQTGQSAEMGIVLGAAMLKINGVRTLRDHLITASRRRPGCAWCSDKHTIQPGLAFYGRS